MNITNRTRNWTLGLLLIVAGLGWQTARAAVINVPADQPTIQNGIDAAVNGDVVVVAPGTYSEAIDQLLPNSPAIDAGDATLVPQYPSQRDAAGSQRLIDDPATPDTGVLVFGLPVDLGAYEYDAASACEGDLSGDGVVDLTDLGVLLSVYGTTCP